VHSRVNARALVIGPNSVGIVAGFIRMVFWFRSPPRRFAQAATETAGAVCRNRRGREVKGARAAERGAGANDGDGSGLAEVL